MWPSAFGIITVNLPGVVACVLLLATLALAASAWRSLTTKHITELQRQVTQPATETEPDAESLQLYTTEEIKRRALSCGRAECAQAAGSSTSSSCAHYRALVGYLEAFLAKPHADVGRAGPVCPFVPLSLKKQTVLVGMVRTQPTVNGSSFGVDEMVALMRRQRERFLRMEPTSGRMKLYKAMVIGFPDIADEDAPRLIDRVQRQLKSEFTLSGMMIGEFHRQNKTPGLRNAAFCPLQTPVPALAIRFMVPTDVLFLKHDAAYLEAYLSTIPDNPTNAPYRAEAHQAMQEIHGNSDHGQAVY